MSCKDCTNAVGRRNLWCHLHYKHHLDSFTNIDLFLTERGLRTDNKVEISEGFIIPILTFDLYVLLSIFDPEIRPPTYVAVCLMVKHNNMFRYYPTSENRLVDYLTLFCDKHKIISCQGIGDTQAAFALFGKDDKTSTKMIGINEFCLEMWKKLEFMEFPF